MTKLIPPKELNIGEDFVIFSCKQCFFSRLGGIRKKITPQKPLIESIRGFLIWQVWNLRMLENTSIVELFCFSTPSIIQNKSLYLSSSGIFVND